MTVTNAVAVVVDLHRGGVIKNYAITGAVASLRYIEPFLTADVDILIAISDLEEHKSGLILLGPIEAALAKMGYIERSDAGILVEGWPVQFIPVASALDEAALVDAVDADLGGNPPVVARVLRPEFLVAKAVSVGRLKDLARIEAFLDQDAVDLFALKSVIERFGLKDIWKSYLAKAGRADPLRLE